MIDRPRGLVAIALYPVALGAFALCCLALAGFEALRWLGALRLTAARPPVDLHP